jgi:hypothetical protein
MVLAFCRRGLVIPICLYLLVGRFVPSLFYQHRIIFLSTLAVESLLPFLLVLLGNLHR